GYRRRTRRHIKIASKNTEAVSARDFGLVEVHRARIVDGNNIAPICAVGNRNFIDIERLTFWHFESNEGVVPLDKLYLELCPVHALEKDPWRGSKPAPFHAHDIAWQY